MSIRIDNGVAIAEGGGSGFGNSYWKQWLECPRKAWLNEEAKLTGEPTSRTKHDSLIIGSCYHIYQQLWRTGEDNPEQFAICISDLEIGNAHLEEARRLFLAYRKKFVSKDFMGETVEVEKCHKYEGAGTEDLIGAEPFTIMPDYVTHVTPEQAEIIASKREVIGGPFLPGYWLVDHKSHGSRSAMHEKQYAHSHQFTAYCVLWQLSNPDKKLNGVLVELAYRYKRKEPEFPLQVVNYPGPGQIESSRRYFSICKQIRDKALQQGEQCDTYSSEQTCFSFGQDCYWFEQGRCLRY